MPSATLHFAYASSLSCAPSGRANLFVAGIAARIRRLCARLFVLGHPSLALVKRCYVASCHSALFFASLLMLVACRYSARKRPRSGGTRKTWPASCRPPPHSKNSVFAFAIAFARRHPWRPLALWCPKPSELCRLSPPPSPRRLYPLRLPGKKRNWSLSVRCVRGMLRYHVARHALRFPSLVCAPGDPPGCRTARQVKGPWRSVRHRPLIGSGGGHIAATLVSCALRKAKSVRPGK